MRLSPALIVIIIVIVSMSAFPVHPARSYVIDDVMNDVIDEPASEASDVTRGVRLLQMMMRSQLCRKHLQPRQLDDTAADGFKVGST